MTPTLSQSTTAQAEVCSGNKNDRNANALRQARFRETPLGQRRAEEQAKRRKAARQKAHSLYMSERRSAVAGCVPGTKRLRDVGVDCTMVGTAAHERAIRARLEA